MGNGSVPTSNLSMIFAQHSNKTMKNLKTHEKETKIRRKFPRNGTEDEWELLLYGLLNLSDEQNGKPFGSAFMPFDFSI